MKRLVSNIAAVAKARVLCLLGLALVVGVNNEAWGANYTAYRGGNWNNPKVWDWWNGLFGSTSYPNGDRDIVTIDGYEITVNETTAISHLILSSNKSKILIDENLSLTGNGTQDPCFEFNGNSAGTITIASNKTLLVAKGFNIASDLTIDGGGKLILARKSNLNSKTLTANVDVEINPSLENAHGYAISNFNIVVNKSLTVNRDNNITFKEFTLNGNGALVLKYNSAVSDKFTYNGGTITIENGKKLTLKKALIVNHDLEIDGKYDIKDVTSIQVKEGCHLSINADLTIDQNVTLSGDIRLGSGKTLTLKGGQITFTGTTDFSHSAGNSTILIKNNATINGLTTCIGGNFVFENNIEYNSSNTCILPGDYPNLTATLTAGRSLSLCGDVEVAGTLTWNNNNTYIYLNEHTLTVKAISASQALGKNHMFIAGGNGMLKYMKPSTGLILHVGTESATTGKEYSPVKFVSGISGSASSYVTVQVMDTAESGHSTDLERYWTIGGSGLAEGSIGMEFTYVDPDDGLNYGDLGVWKVFHNGLKVNENATVGSNKITVTTPDINGVWTAAETNVVTLYTCSNGNWNELTTWTTDPTGKTHVGAEIPNMSHNVVILNGFKVTTVRNETARSVKICAGAELDMGTYAEGHNFMNVYGQGLLSIGAGDFPDKGNYSLFVSPDGGTTRLYGTHAPDAIPHQYTYNNLILEYNENVKRLLSKSLVINGSLTLKKGSLAFTKANQSITVGGDIDIAATGGIFVYGAGSKTQADTIVVGGNFINRGDVIMNQRNTYNLDEAISAEGSAGRGIIRFVGEKNVEFNCYSTTKLSQLIIDKGTDQTYRVKLYSSNASNFQLMGNATNFGNQGGINPQTQPDQFNNQDNPPQILKPLWLRNGTLELTGYVEIKSLSEGGGDNFFIPLNGCLHLNGENVKVYVCINGGKGNRAFMPAGKFILDAGLFDASSGSGAVFRNTSEIYINGGTFRAAQLRPSQNVDGGKTTYVQTGGTAIFDSQGEEKAGYATFHMPFETYTFKMTGGTLKIYGAQATNGGSFAIKCNPENSKITGGEIIVSAVKNDWTTKNKECRMISTIPLYNLTLANEDGRTSDVYTNHTYTDFSGDVNGNPVSVEADKLYVKNNLKICSGVTFLTKTGGVLKDIEVGGDLIIESGATLIHGNNTITLNGDGSRIQQFTSDGTVKKDNGLTFGYYNLIIDDNADVQVNSDIIVRNDFTLGEGAKMRDGAANTYTLQGKNITINGTHLRPVSGAGKIEFKGDSPTISGNGNGSLNNVNVELTSGVLAINARNITINGDLRLLNSGNNSSGRVSVEGTSKLTFGPEAHIYTDEADGQDFGERKIIYTNGLSSSGGVAKVYSEDANSFLFPFGTKNGSNYYYTPALITYKKADVYGTVTSMPVLGAHPLIGNADQSLAYYWVTKEDGFSGVPAGDLEQNYTYLAGHVNGSVSQYVPARYHNAEWGKGVTGDMHPGAYNFDYNTATNASGEYTCGDPTASFVDILKLYSSNYVTTYGNTGNWDDPRSWSIDSVNGVPNVKIGDTYYKYNGGTKYVEYDPATGDEIVPGGEIQLYESESVFNSALPIPTATTAVRIGSANHNHTITMTDNGQSCATLRIEPGSTLDLGVFTGHTFSLVEVDESAEEGAGTLRIASSKGYTNDASFPSGDFVAFLGEHGGTVDYFGEIRIPVTSESGLELKNYCNLTISREGNSIRFIPQCDVTIYKDLTINGGNLRTQTTNFPQTIIVNGNININKGSLELRSINTHLKKFIINGDINIRNNAQLITTGNSSIAHQILIARNLNVIDEGGLYNTYYTDNQGNLCKVNTIFFGTDTSRITGTGTIQFYTLTCDKGSDASAMLIAQNPNISSAHDEGESFLELKHGTFQIDFPSDDNSIDLNTNCDLIIATPTRLSVKKGTVNVCNYDNNHELTLNGSIDVQGGILNIGDQSKDQSNSIVYSATSTPTITVSGGQMNVNGVIRRTTGTRYGSLIYHQSGGIVVVKGKDRAANAPDGNSAFEVMNAGSEFITTGGELIIQATDGGDRFGDVLIEPTIANCTGGSIIFDGGSEQKMLSATSLHRIVVNGGSQLHVYSYPITTDSLEIADGAVFDSRGFDLTIKSGLSNKNSSSASGIDAGGFLAGSNSQTTYFTGNNVRLGGATGNLTNFANVVINGRLALFDANSDIMVNRNLTLTYGTVTDNGSNIRLVGDLENYGTFVSNKSTGGLDFCGTITEQYIKGVGTGSLGSVTINNTHKVFLYTDTRIDNKLTLNSILYADIYQLTLGERASIDETVGLDETKMILLNGAQEDKGVRKIVPNGSSSFTIPIGVDGFYTPAQYSFNKNTSGEETSLTVKTVDYLNKNLTEKPSTYLKYFWVVTTEGFNEEGIGKNEANPDFAVTQTYTYPADETHLVVEFPQTESSMLPEYLHTLGEYEWVDFKTGDKATLDAANHQIIFNPSFGHLEGEYTAGIVHDAIYTGLPVLYSNGIGGGKWHVKSTWRKKDEDGNDVELGETEEIGENPVHLRESDIVEVDEDDTKSYCLYFDNVNATLDCSTSSGNDFGRVYGSGTLKIDATAKGNYLFPAGNFEKFLKYSTSTVEFGGSNNGTLPASPGNASRPLPNVKFSGSGIKTLPAGISEEIDGDLTIEADATLNNAANNIKIIVRGDWTDENTLASGFNAGSSIVEFNGDSTQRINVYNDNTVFPNLIINNIGVESDSIIIGNCDKNSALGKEIKVSSKLTLTEGHVHTDLANCLIVSEATASITGGSLDSYIDGPLGIYTTAKSNPKYPVGNENRFASTSLNNVSVSGVWKVQYFNQQSANEAVDGTMVAPLTGVSENEYWRAYPPAGNDNATANLTLRYDDLSFPQIRTAAQLKKLTMVSYPNPDVWAIVKNSGASGTITSGTITSTEDAQTVAGKEFTLGFLGTTARLTPGNYYVCDGNNSVEIPVALTGTPNYTLQYTIDGGAPITITDITTGSYKLILTASTLGGHKHDGEGNPLPYVVRLASVSDPSGSGNAFTADIANVYVWYNEVPTINGDNAVGQGDTHSYSVSTSGKWATSSAWKWSGSGSGAVTIANAASSSTDITFGYGLANKTATGTYTLTATNTYKTTDATKECSASQTLSVNVQTKPQPKIVADNGSFSSCYGEEHTYSVSEVINHTYSWTVTGGTIKNNINNQHECTVIWGNSGSGTIKVVETGKTNGSGDDEKEIFFYPSASISDEDIIAPSFVCDNTRGVVKIENSLSTLQYMVCDYYDENVVYSGYQSGNGGELTITIDAIRTQTQIRVKTKNDGCSAKTALPNTIKVSPNPTITWAIGEDLYIGKPANLHLEQTSAFNGMSYKFTNTVGSNDRSGDFANPASIDIELPIATNATKLEGTLRVTETSTTYDCFSDYKIEKDVSQDYLWNGSESDAWETGTNWWAATPPTASKNVIIPDVTNKPKITTAATAANITINSGASITLSDNTLTVSGDLTNNGEIVAGGGKIAFTAGNHNVTGENTFTDVDNAGNVTFNSTNTIKGNIDNRGTISGNIVLNNTNKQTLIGNGSFGSVTVNNSAGISVEGDITINGNLILQSGLVTVDDNKTLTFGTSAVAQSNSVDAYVIGSMKKFGNSPFTFPTGDSDHRALVQVIPIGGTSEAWFTASYSSTGNEELVDKDRAEGLVRVSSIDMWNIRGEDGNGNTQSSQIKLFWDDANRSGISDDKNSLVIAHYAGGSWEIVRRAECSLEEGWIMSQIVDNYSPFTFGSTKEEEHPLPVTFVAFTGHQVGNTVVLDWATASENDNNYFEIERSTDGVNYVTIGYVDGAGNSSSLLGYQFADNAPEQGQLYYRLSQVDFDGNREYADKVVAVLYTGSEIENLTIVPNPTDGLFKVSASGSMAGGRIELLSQSGQVVRIVDVDSFDATIDISDMPSGIYILRFVTDTKVLQQKVVKY